jgi:hypothetical protein
MHIKVDVQVERAADALGLVHRAALRAGPRDARLLRLPVADHAMHDGQHRTDGLWLAGEQPAQGEGNAQHSLPHRARAEHVFHQTCPESVEGPVLSPVEGCRALSAMRRAPQLGQKPVLSLSKALS